MGKKGENPGNIVKKSYLMGVSSVKYYQKSKQNKVESQHDFFREIASQPPKKLCAPNIFFQQHQDEFALILFHMSHVI